MASSVTNCFVPFSKYVFSGLSALCALFFMIGAIGYSHEKSVMKNVPWLYVTYPNPNGNERDVIYYSLKGQYIEDWNNAGDYASISETRFEKCDTDGHSAYVLVVIACVCSVTCASLSGAMIKVDFTLGQFVAALLAFLATFMSGIALAVFMGDCQNALAKYYDNRSNQFKYYWGAGSILTAVAMVLMFVVSLGMFLTARFCAAPNDKKAAAVPTSEETEPVDNPMML